MACEEIHVGDTGTALVVTLVNDCDGTIFDASGATDMKIYLRKPDGVTVLTKTASFVTDGTDGRIKYITIASDFDVSGTWRIQAEVTTPSGEWSTDVVKFKVYSNIY